MIVTPQILAGLVIAMVVVTADGDVVVMVVVVVGLVVAKTTLFTYARTY